MTVISINIINQPQIAYTYVLDIILHIESVCGYKDGANSHFAYIKASYFLNWYNSQTVEALNIECLHANRHSCIK